jgi:hypothetical protein
VGDTKQRLEAIKARWLGRTCTERERADLEEEAWELSLQLPELHGPRGRAGFLSRWLGQPSDLPAARNALRRGGTDAQALWDRVQTAQPPMPLRTAHRLWRVACARTAGARSVPRSQAVAAVLVEYDRLTPTMVNGQLVRKQPHGRMPPTLDGLGASVAPRLTKPGPEVKHTQLWQHIRQCVAELIRRRLPLNLDATVQQQLLQDFDGELNGLFDSLRARLSRLQNTEALFTAITRKQLSAACTALMMDAPPPHKPVPIGVARKQRNRLVRHYHPDRHGGSEAMRPQYEAVVEAYALVERYNQQLGRGVTAVIDGGAKEPSAETQPPHAAEQE